MDPLDKITYAEPDAEEEISGDLDPDPKPGRVRRARKTTAPAAAPQRVTGTPRAGGKFVSKAAQVKDIQKEIEAWLLLGAAGWSLTDSGCAGVLTEQTKALAEAAATLISRNDRLVEMFHTGTLIGDIGKLVIALAPVFKVIWAHHGPGAIREEEAAASVDYDRFPAYAPR